MASDYAPTPVSGFLDPDDPILFPRLTAAQIEQLAEHAETVSFSPGEILFEQGQRDTPFFVVLSGAVDIIDRQPDGDHYFTQVSQGRSLPTSRCSRASRRLPEASLPRRRRCWSWLPMNCAGWSPAPRSSATSSYAPWSCVASG